MPGATIASHVFLKCVDVSYARQTTVAVIVVIWSMHSFGVELLAAERARAVRCTTLLSVSKLPLSNAKSLRGSIAMTRHPKDWSTPLCL